MRVLGIESSCDETAIALVEFDSEGHGRVAGEVLASQVDMHQAYGGVVPELAAREHMRALPILTSELLTTAAIDLKDIDLVGVTVGPGLKGCLLAGVMFAQGLATGAGIRLRGVNHVEGHMLAGELHNPELVPPYLSIVVSGAHTEITKVHPGHRYEIVARTTDDAAGEAFDKAGNLLGFAYPGGAALAALADSVTASRFILPRVAREITDFSFSGLKTAIALAVRKNAILLHEDAQARAEMCWAVQDAIVEAIVRKVTKAVKGVVDPIVLGGGVAANQELRRRLVARFGSRVLCAPLRHCVDNAAMIAFAAGRAELHGLVDSGLEIRSRWPVDALR